MAEVKITITGEDKSSGAFSSVAQSANTAVSQTKSVFDSLKQYWIAITGAMIAAWMSLQKVLDIAMLSARVETLGVVMGVIGENIGYSKKEMEGFVEEVRQMGITTQEARQSIISMAEAHLDLTKASELARVAQDAAVIGNTNSSEALQRIVYGIQSAQAEMLRTIGINVNFENAYAKSAAQMNRNVESLTEYEKAQIRMNAVLEKGKDIQGAYDAAMGTVGKQLTSLPRYIEEVRLKLGDMLSPALGVLVSEFTENLKILDKQLADMSKSGAANEWAYKLATDTRESIASVVALNMMLDKTGGALTMIGYILAGGSLTKVGRQMLEWNKMFEERYKGSERYLSDLGTRAIQTAADLGKGAKDAGEKIKGMANAEQDMSKAVEAATAAVKSQRSILDSMYKTLAGDFSKVFNDLKKKQQELFDIKLTTGDLVSQVKQTLMDPFDKYNTQVRQLRDKEDMAMKLSGEAKIKLLQSVQQQWASMTGEIKVGDTVWKTAEMTASTAIRNIESIGSAIEAEKGKQIEDAASLLEKVRGEYDKLKTLESDVLTLKIDTSEFMSKIKESQAAVQALRTNVEGSSTEANIDFTGSGSETLPISDKIDQIKDQLGSLATDASYNLDLSAFTSAANLMYSITSQMKTAGFWGATDLDWMKNIVSEIEQAMSLSIAREQVAYTKERLGLEELTGVEGSYQSGTSYVPKTGLYRLHEGEQVKTTREASNNDNRNYRTVNVNIPSIQVIARDSDDPKALARKIVKPLQQELKRLEALS